jgi:hypothetical protein
MATCPKCDRPVRLTEEELSDKRGFCANCDARFTITPEVLEAGPFRDGQVVTLEAEARPPTAFIRDVSDGDTVGFELRPSYRKAAWIGVFFAFVWWGFLIIWYRRAAASGDLAMLLFPVLHVGAGLFLVYWVVFMFAGRETVTLADGVLSTARGVGPLRRRRRVPLAEIHEIRAATQVSSSRSGQVTSWVAKVLRPGAEPLLIGRHLQLSEEAIRWLAHRLDEARHRR